MNTSLEWLTPTAFWDVDFASLDLERDAHFVIHKVFNYGTLNDIIFVLKHYGYDKAKSELLRANYLTNQTLSLASTIFTVPPTDFACYTRKQSTKELWPY